MVYSLNKTTSAKVRRGVRLGKIIVGRCKRVTSRLSGSPSMTAWIRDRGDKTLRLDYDLGDDSMVFDLGGYEGQWSSDIFAKYRCLIHIFEPVEEFATNIEKRFAKNDKVVVHRFGLSNRTFKTNIFVDADATSVFKPSSESRLVSLIKA